MIWMVLVTTPPKRTGFLLWSQFLKSRLGVAQSKLHASLQSQCCVHVSVAMDCEPTYGRGSLQLLDWRSHGYDSTLPTQPQKHICTIVTSKCSTD